MQRKDDAFAGLTDIQIEGSITPSPDFFDLSPSFEPTYKAPPPLNINGSNKEQISESTWGTTTSRAISFRNAPTKEERMVIGSAPSTIMGKTLFQCSFPMGSFPDKKRLYPMECMRVSRPHRAVSDPITAQYMKRDGFMLDSISMSRPRKRQLLDGPLTTFMRYRDGMEIKNKVLENLKLAPPPAHRTKVKQRNRNNTKQAKTSKRNSPSSCVLSPSLVSRIERTSLASPKVKAKIKQKPRSKPKPRPNTAKLLKPCTRKMVVMAEVVNEEDLLESSADNNNITHINGIPVVQGRHINGKASGSKATTSKAAASKTGAGKASNRASPIKNMREKKITLPRNGTANGENKVRRKPDSNNKGCQGNKCPFNGCERRFASQPELEHHFSTHQMSSSWGFGDSVGSSFMRSHMSFENGLLNPDYVHTASLLT